MLLKINKQFSLLKKIKFYSTNKKLTGRKIRLNAFQVQARIQKGEYIAIPKDSDSQQPNFDGNPFLTVFEYDETEDDLKNERGEKKLKSSHFLPIFLVLLTFSYLVILSAQPKGLKHELIKLKEYWQNQMNSILPKK
eukprot:gene10418-2945_t